MEAALASDDVFANENELSDSHYQGDSWLNIRTVWYITSELINFMLCLVNIAANLFLIIIILKYKRLRTRTNFYLVNIAITNTIYHAFLPLSIIILEVTGLSFSMGYCLCFLVEESACFTMYLFAAILTLDWYLVNYKKQLVQLHQKLYKLAIAIVYLIGIIRYIILAVTDCLYKVAGLEHFLYVSYILSLVVAGVVNIIRAGKPVDSEITKTRYALLAGNVILISWLPLLGYHLLEIYGMRSIILIRIVYATILLPKILAHGNTIILLVILGRVSKSFQTAYARAFRKKVRDYEQDDLDNESEDEEAVVEHHVDIDTKPLTGESSMDKIMIY